LLCESGVCIVFFFQAEDGIRDRNVTGVQTCALPICCRAGSEAHPLRASPATDPSPTSTRKQQRSAPRPATDEPRSGPWTPVGPGREWRQLAGWSGDGPFVAGCEVVCECEHFGPVQWRGERGGCG